MASYRLNYSPKGVALLNPSTAWTSVIANRQFDSGSIALLVSSTTVTFSETSVLARLRAFISAVAEAWSETGVLARKRASISAVTETWAETSVLQRLRRLIASAGEVWTELSTLARQRVLGAAVAQVWAETANMSRFAGLLSSGSARWSENSLLFNRLGLVATATQVRSAASILFCVRGVRASATAVWSQLSAIASGNVALSANAAFYFSETSRVSRQRGLVTAVAIQTSNQGVLSLLRQMQGFGSIEFIQFSNVSISQSTLTPTPRGREILAGAEQNRSLRSPVELAAGRLIAGTIQASRSSVSGPLDGSRSVVSGSSSLLANRGKVS